MRKQTLATAVSVALALTLVGCEQLPGPGPGEKPPPPPPVPLPVNDTGVGFYGKHTIATNPYDIPAPSNFQSVEAAQDASAGLDYSDAFDADGRLGFKFTKLDEFGAPLQNQAAIWDDKETDSQWRCVKDERTGLTWEVKYGYGDHNPGDLYTWYEPDNLMNGGDPGLAAKEGECGGRASIKGNTYDFINKINTKGLCGFSDWRLPLREEYRSIIDYGVEQTFTVKPNGDLKYNTVSYVDENYFPNLITRKHRWSAETSFNEPTKAWAFHPTDGRSEVHPKACDSNAQGANFTNGVMLVRGPN